MLDVRKTYKLFVGGKFPRPESGRVEALRRDSGSLIANLPLASRKDFREAVVVARKTQPAWAASTAYLKGQILYRIAEMLEGRVEQFVSELTALGVSKPKHDVRAAVDLLVHYAGWSDKYQAVFSSVNPVTSPHFCFSVPEAVGVVCAIAPSGLHGLISILAPIIVGGNTAVILTDLPGLSFAEVLATSDVPGGVVNLLTGRRDELLPEFSRHMDVDALVICSDHSEDHRTSAIQGADNLKRILTQPAVPLEPSPHLICDLQEIKTTWHPVGS